MRYFLNRQGDKSGPELSGEFDNDFAATEWARSWLEANAEHDRYRLSRSDGGRSTLLLRTIAGQWYAMLIEETDAESL